MSVEVLLWLIANGISVVVSSKDLYETYRVWYWVKNMTTTKSLFKVTKRNFRASLFKFLLALLFTLGGLTAVLFEGVTAVWFLIAGSIVLTADVILESKFRSFIFKTSEERETFHNLEQELRGKTKPPDRDS